MRGWQAPLLATALLLAAPLAASQATPHTPAVGSAERKAILDALRSHPDFRFTFRHLRVWQDGDRAIAYAEGDNGVIGGFKIILSRDGDAGWRTVWGEGDGGSDSCAAGARHYAWAVTLIASYHIDADKLFPGITDQTREFERMAKEDPELQCTGDLEGGPE
ncbi:hypothetical protein SAMN05428974_2939 [Sphingopyxis sp. YR583]|jgi:hypothetical protein|uniref:hypothetical protein n=1 Tax=Sphingopyxis sp. YR583 TaxID=1881047 RepID=UPI0008A7348A|nr:hypothetical protein [Sphingopyxis sp. YR583]SEH18702.1 hypothetical protein SAMN05428974_2939 [Sphingopyxis sp. YR583]